VGSIGAGAANNRKFRVGEVGGWCVLEEQIANNSATLDFILTSYLGDFEDFEFMVSDLLPAVDAVHLWLRTSSNGGGSYDAGASDYSWTNPWYSPGAVSGDFDAADSQVSLAGNSVGQSLSNSAGEAYSGKVCLYNASAASPKVVTGQAGFVASDGDWNWTSISGRRNSSADVDAVRFMLSNGTIASGKITLLGRRRVT
jgi:hypothetical protein